MTAILSARPRIGSATLSRSLKLAILYLAVAILLTVPMLFVEVPLGVDTLEHLARIHVRAHIGEDADLARVFALRNGAIPYLGMDVLLTPLARVLPVLLVGRLFIVMLAWGVVGTALVLQRVFTGRIGPEPAVLVLAGYGGLLGWGFLNYLLGMLGALLGVAAWHAWRDKPVIFRAVVFTGIATALYLTHLLSFGLYGLLLGLYELCQTAERRSIRWREWALLVIQAAPAMILWSRLPAVELVGSRFLWSLASKPAALFSPVQFSESLPGTLTGCLILIAMAIGGLRATRLGLLSWHPILARMAIGLALMTLLSPVMALGVFGIDVRFPLPALMLAVAAARLRPNDLPRARLRLMALSAMAGIAVLAIVQIAIVTREMLRCDRHYGELRSALDGLPRGTVLSTVMEFGSAPLSCTPLRAYEHVAGLITIDRSGFSPDFFAQATSVAVRDNRPTDQSTIEAETASLAGLPGEGAILWLHLGHELRPLQSRLQILSAGSFFTLYAAPVAGPRIKGRP